MQQSLRTLQLCILDIAIEFRRICDKHNLQYFLIGGSLLGAVRHQGFIPWDDDMDVGMLRAEYEKFLRIAKKEIKDPFFLQTYKTDKSYGFSYARIRINGTKLVEDYAVDSKQHNGIFLDIFPYDVMPDGVMKQKMHYLLCKCTRWAALGKCDYKFIERKKKIFANVMKIVFLPLSKNKCAALNERVCKMFSGTRTRRSINLLGAYDYKEYCNTKDLIKPILLSFEGYQFKVPNHYEKLLTHMYGDYMQLPPVEKRGDQHRMVDINLGSYKIKSGKENDCNMTE